MLRYLSFLCLTGLCGFLAQPIEARADAPQLQLNPSVKGHSDSAEAAPAGLPYDKILEGPITDYVLKTMGSSGKLGEYAVQSMMLTQKGYREQETSGESCAHSKPYWLLYNIKTQQGIAVALAYSGNWSFEIKSQGSQTALHLDTLPAGLKAFDKVGDIPIPGALVSEFTGAWDYGAQPIARYIRAHLERDHGEDWPWVQYNTWYAASGNPTEKLLLGVIPKAAAVGCELITLDAGWHGLNARSDWGTTLGDWKINPDRCTHGLAMISDAFHKAGMKFGLWFEIECAGKGSDIVKAHPDWFLHNHYAYGRMIFDVNRPEVMDYLERTLDSYVNDCHLDYIKLDFNTPLSSNGEKDPSGNDLAYSHTRGLVAIWKHLRAAHPQLIVENCASGSHREDVLPAAFTDTHWVSDRIDNHSNLMMSYGYSYLFPPEMCSHWTVNPDAHDPAMDIEAQFNVNMMGHFGLSGSLWNWDGATLNILKDRIQFYKSIRSVIRQSDVYHLTGQAAVDHPRSIQAVFYVDPGSRQALLFAFQAGDPSRAATLKIPGLQPGASYRVIWPEGFGQPEIFTGQQLSDQGLTVTFPHPGSSAIILIQPSANR